MAIRAYYQLNIIHSTLCRMSSCNGSARTTMAELVSCVRKKNCRFSQIYWLPHNTTSMLIPANSFMAIDKLHKNNHTSSLYFIYACTVSISSQYNPTLRHGDELHSGILHYLMGLHVVERKFPRSEKKMYK